MISDEPSKIRQIRRSRRICSAGTGFSPRAWSEAAVSKPRPPRIWTISSATCQAISEQYSLASAASMRMSCSSASARRLDSSTTASCANVKPAMKAIFSATASCLPMGMPHWTRSLAQSLTILSESFEDDAQMAGSDRRPVLSVCRATFSPRPSPPTTSSAGTRTFSNRVTPFSMPRSPMNWLRWSTFTPGAWASTMKAVMPPRCPSERGTLAITTSRSAMTPLVVQSFWPLMT